MERRKTVVLDFYLTNLKTFILITLRFYLCNLNIINPGIESPSTWDGDGEGDRDPHLWSLRSNGNIQTRGQGGQPGQTDLYSDQTPSYEKLSRTGPGPHHIPASFKIILTNIQEIRTGKVYTDARNLRIHQPAS